MLYNVRIEPCFFTVFTCKDNRHDCVLLSVSNVYRPTAVFICRFLMVVHQQLPPTIPTWTHPPLWVKHNPARQHLLTTNQDLAHHSLLKTNHKTAHHHPLATNRERCLRQNRECLPLNHTIFSTKSLLVIRSLWNRYMYIHVQYTAIMMNMHHVYRESGRERYLRERRENRCHPLIGSRIPLVVESL